MRRFNNEELELLHKQAIDHQFIAYCTSKNTGNTAVVTAFSTLSVAESNLVLIELWKRVHG